MLVGSRSALRTLAIAVAIAGALAWLTRVATNFDRAIHAVKIAVAALAAVAFVYEQRRAAANRPISVRSAKIVALTFGVISIALYFNVFQAAYAKWYHRHDQYHYYIGAKYFPELGYERLYRCTAIAEDELGVVHDATGKQLDLRREVHRASSKVRDLGATNLLVPAKDVLAEPSLCKAHFSSERWEQFKKDISFFRVESERSYWKGMQKDHGFNPPPLWILGGRLLAELRPASVLTQQLLGAVDVLLNVGMFAAIYWAFGFRVFAVAAVVWGTEGAADPYFWTGGAFLRQDWLFFSVLAVCLARKHYPALAAASLVYAALLRIFPALMGIGWLVVAAYQLVRQKKVAPTYVRILAGGTVTACVLVLASCYFVGEGRSLRERWQSSYGAFYAHTIVIHDKTPLANHMGLRVLVAHEPGASPSSEGGVATAIEPSQRLSDMRNTRYAKYEWTAWIVVLGAMAAFVVALRRVRLPWVAQGLGILCVVLLSQLTNYYYGFVLCAVPLIVRQRKIELSFYGYVIATGIIGLAVRQNEDKYALHTLAALMLSLSLVAFMWPKHTWPARRMIPAP